MKENRKKYWTLFVSVLQLSAFTFGGGFVIIPLMRKKFVEKLHWLTEQEMMDLTAIAQSSPGAIAVNASLLVGYRVAGIPGAMLTVCGTILPPLIIIALVSMFYTAFRDNAVVNMAMSGMLAAVAAVLGDVVLTMGRSVLRDRRPLYGILMLGCFAAARFLEVNVVWLLLICGVVGAVDGIHNRKEGRTA